jgi:spore coat protein U-like protein
MKFHKLAIALAAALGTVGAAHAATATANFNVTANVSASCAVSATNLAFGAYDPASATALDSTSTISVTCTNTTPYSVDVGATPTTRIMTGPGGATLAYGMYNETGRTTAFGVASATGTGVAQPYTVFGRVPVGQFGATPGAYLGTVTVTVTYP